MRKRLTHRSSTREFLPSGSFTSHLLLPILAATLAATLLAQPVSAGSSGIALAKCDSMITADTTLGGDLTNCPGDGIVIGADNITLDLNGHTIDGDATPGITVPDIGIRNDGHDGVTIEGGRVQEFDRGVALDNASSNRLRQLTAVDNSGRGINLDNGSNGNLIAGNNSLNNGRSGLGLFSSDYNLVGKNTLSGNGAAGLFAVEARHNLAEQNVASNNGDQGLRFGDGSDQNRIDRNSVFHNFAGIVIETNANEVTGNHVFENLDDINLGGDDNALTGNLVTDALGCDEGEDGIGCGFGISVEGGSHNLVAGNIVARTFHAGIRLDNYRLPVIGNVFRDNTVRAAGTDGIAIDEDQVGPVLDTLLDGNVTIGAADDGIDVNNATTTLIRNLAVHNGDLGIEAVPGVIDGGGNHAAGNGNPAQCTNVAC